MIVLGLLQWGNAFSYGEGNSIDFRASPLTQLLGKNGHGKSSIALILEEVLYNKNSKGIKRADIINRYVNAKSYWIKLSFTKNNAQYLIHTVRGSTQSVKLFENGTDISSHTSTATYKLIEEIMGMDHKTFSQIVYQSSASSLEFLTATDTVRKKFLIDLLDLGIYSKAGEVFKELANTLSKELDKLHASEATITNWLTKFDSSTMVELPIEEPLAEPTGLRNRVAELEVELTNIATTNKKRTNNNLYKQQLDAIVLDNTTYPDVTIPRSDTLLNIAARSTIMQEAKAFQGKYTKLSDHCPTCKQSVDNSTIKVMLSESKAKEEVAAVESLILAKKLAEYMSIHSKASAAAIAKAEWEKYHTLYDPTMSSELLVASDLNKEIKSIKDSIEAILKSIKATVEQNTRATAHNTKIKVLLEQEGSMRTDLYVLQADIDSKQDKLSTLQLLVKTFGNTGLVAYKIECLVKDLESLTNEYLAELYGGRFQLSFAISSGDKLNVIITDNGRDVDILALSSGERARVNVATLLAIRKLMQSLSSSRINLLVLDETVSNLDTEGKEKLIEVLLAEENLNTILVSHDFSHPLLEKVSVVKENNVSRIE